jgi:hypothetical protein
VIVFAAALLLVGSSCGPRPIDRFVPKAEDAFGRRVLEQLQRGELDSVLPLVNPDLGPADSIRAGLRTVAETFPAGPPATLHVIGVYTSSYANVGNTGHESGTRVILIYEFEFPNHWLVANILIRNIAGKLIIDGVHAQPTADSQEHLNAFSLRGKSPGHYVMLGATLAVPVFILVVLLILRRTKVPRRKWAWVLGVLFGFGGTSFNWTTGQAWFTPLQFLLLGASWFQTPYGPVTLSVAIPIGAIVFLWKRHEWRLAKLQQPPPAPGVIDAPPPGLGTDAPALEGRPNRTDPDANVQT